MNSLSKSVVALTSAALLAAGGVATAGAASAAPAGHRPVAGSHHRTPPHHRKPVDKLAGPRKAAASAIMAQYRLVQRLAKRAATQTGEHASALQTALAADLAAITNDLTAVPAATSIKGLNAIRAAGDTTRLVAGTQYSAVSSTDGLAGSSADLASLVTSLQSQLDELLAGGTDTSAAQAALDAIDADLTDAVAQLGALADQALALLPTATRTELRTAAAALDSDLPTISDTLDAIQGELAEFASTYSL